MEFSGRGIGPITRISVLVLFAKEDVYQFSAQIQLEIFKFILQLLHTSRQNSKKLNHCYEIKINSNSAVLHMHTHSRFLSVTNN